jgi:hypothetical protein
MKSNEEDFLVDLRDIEESRKDNVKRLKLSGDYQVGSNMGDKDEDLDEDFVEDDDFGEDFDDDMMAEDDLGDFNDPIDDIEDFEDFEESEDQKEDDENIFFDEWDQKCESFIFQLHFSYTK